MFGLMVVLLMPISRMLTMVLVYGKLLLFLGMDMEFRDKTMLHGFKKVEGQPGFTLGT